MCTDVAARGLDIPYVSNVVHYQCPYNAEIYVHRCGRTARVGRNGDSLAILNPEDSKAFRSICLVLKKTEDSFTRFEVQFNVLDKIKPLIDQAKDLEKTIHHKNMEEKSANWMLHTAEEAELCIEEDLQHKLHSQLGEKGRKNNLLKDSRLDEFKHDDGI